MGMHAMWNGSSALRRVRVLRGVRRVHGARVRAADLAGRLDPAARAAHRARANCPRTPSPGWLAPRRAVRAGLDAGPAAGPRVRRATTREGRRRARWREYEAYATSLAFLRHRGRRGPGGRRLRRTGAGVAARAVAPPGDRPPGPGLRGPRDGTAARAAALAGPRVRVQPRRTRPSRAPAPRRRRIPRTTRTARRARARTGRRHHRSRHRPGAAATRRSARVRPSPRSAGQFLVRQHQVGDPQQRRELLHRAGGGDRRGDRRLGGAMADLEPVTVGQYLGDSDLSRRQLRFSPTTPGRGSRRSARSATPTACSSATWPAPRARRTATTGSERQAGARPAPRPARRAGRRASGARGRRAGRAANQ